MNSNTRNSAPLREQEVNRFRKLQEIFDKFFKWLFGVIAFKSTPFGEALFKTHPNVMKVMVLMIVLYFLVWMLGTILRDPNGILKIIFICIILVIGSVFSILVLTIISSHIAWFTLMLWVGIFAVIAYYYYQELCKLVACASSDTIKKLIESYKRQRTGFPI